MTRPLLRAADRHRFAADGYLVLPDAVPLDVIEVLRREADGVRDRLLAGVGGAHCHEGRITWWKLADGSAYLLKIKPVLDRSSAASELAHGSLAALAGDLLGTRSILMEDKFMYKQRLGDMPAPEDLPVLGEEIRKHTDAAYFAARGYDRVVTVAVCLDDCEPDSGPLRVWPGSHRTRSTMVSTRHQGPVVADADAPDAAAETLTVPAGTVIAWDAALVHASEQNQSGNPRRLLVLGYAAASTVGAA
ncbi:phytanoyl-CoA dioxygenase family protein [Catellatospora paridis]|uniref:phytanoyl-CoA dioxygenase family protein n=1 Tax=Catellatospora paridis TaxID=1617086 RepID=UPI0012D41548|nr:phytanoyl-CoA dioxygenase family protein [Catellatospora paridis]